jgi:5-methyltetrahydrofolate--homocysteine methyltransferase
MKPFLQRLREGEIMVADGAMGTMLFEKGVKQGMCPESLNLSRPEILQEIAALYFNAGAEIIQTNTFGGSTVKLADYGLDDKVGEINTLAVVHVRKVVGNEAFISGSCGPSGKILKPLGDADPDQVSEGFHRQLKALIEAGVDLLCIETMTDLQEAVLAVEVARSINAKIPIMATMTFEPTTTGFFTMMGISIAEAAEGLTATGANVLGSNCGNGIENMIKIAQEFKSVTPLPLIIQANAGIPELREGKSFYPETPEFFAEKVPALIDAGVSIIGGCCGTTPEHIRAIRKAVETYR